MHIPVLLDEVIKYLDPKAGENFIDCTAGFGGHSKAILEKTGPNGKLLAIEWDNNQIADCKENLKEFAGRVIVANGNYADLSKIAEESNFTNVSGILLDLGFSSGQIDIFGKGFSFLKNEPLDMRYSDANQITAQEILNKWPEGKIKEILENFGEEKFARQIATEIIKERKLGIIADTQQLVKIIKKAIPIKFQHGKIHCATRTFQALRIAVNRELDNLEKVLPQAISVLESKGRLAIISFHSLEDRIVKNFFRQEAQKGTVKLISKKPIITTEQEIKKNPRSRSAKLRLIQKL